MVKKKAAVKPNVNESAKGLISFLNNILAISSAEGKETVSLDRIVQYMRNNGYNVSRESILPVLNDSPFVSAVSGSEVELDDKNPPELVGTDPEDVVSQMASDSI